MLLKYLPLLVTIFTVHYVHGVCEEGETPQKCWTVRCGNVESCPFGQKLILRNPEECICCNRCEPEESICNRVDCQPSVTCTEDQRLEKANSSLGICCDHCVHKIDTEQMCHLTCIASLCLYCPPEDVLVPADIKNCKCCPICRSRWPRWHSTYLKNT